MYKCFHIEKSGMEFWFLLTFALMILKFFWIPHCLFVRARETVKCVTIVCVRVLCIMSFTPEGGVGEAVFSRQ